MKDNARASGGEAVPSSPNSAVQADTRSDRAGDEALSLVEVANMFLRQRRLVLGIPLLTILLGLGSAIWMSGGYTASSRFTPELPRDATSTALSGIAAQFGFNLMGAGAGQLLAFYTEVLDSREILRDAATTTYRFPVGRAQRDTLSGTLIDLYQIEGPTESARLRSAVSRLREDITTRVEGPAGLIAVETTAPWAELAVQVNRRLLDLVAEFNSERRQSQARAEREFIETRLRAAQQELMAAEAELRTFLERNRQFTNSAQLSFEYGRLQRQVTLRQQLYTSLAQAHDQARIEEVRNTPIITIMEPPDGSARSNGGALPLILVVAAVLGVILGLILAFIRDHLTRHRRGYPEEYAEFDELRHAAMADLSPRRLAAFVSRLRDGRWGDRRRAAATDAAPDTERERVG